MIIVNRFAVAMWALNDRLALTNGFSIFRKRSTAKNKHVNISITDPEVTLDNYMFLRLS